MQIIRYLIATWNGRPFCIASLNCPNFYYCFALGPGNDNASEALFWLPVPVLPDWLPDTKCCYQKSTEMCRRLQMFLAALIPAELDGLKAMLRQTTSSCYSNGLEVLISSRQKGVPLKTEKLAHTSVLNIKL